MSLEHAYPVYGRLVKDGVPLTSKTVTIEDVGNSQFTTGITDDSGYYTINIQSIATDGHTIKVYFDEESTTWSQSFTLDISTPSKKMDFDIYPGLTKTHDVDGNLVGEYSRSELTDALTQAERRKDYEIDSLLKAVDLSKDIKIDSLLENANRLLDYEIDALTQIEDKTREYLTDALGELEDLTTEEKIDVLILSLGIRRHMLQDVLVELRDSTNYNIDSLTSAERKETYDIDSLLQTLNISRDVETDSLLETIKENNYEIEALVEILKSRQVNIDSNLQGKRIIQSLIDSLTRTERNLAYSLESLIETRKDKDISIDVLVQKLDIDKVELIDALSQALGVDIDYNVDSLIEIVKSLDSDIDTLVSELLTRYLDINALIEETNRESHDFESLLKKLSKSKSPGIDVRLGEFLVTWNFDNCTDWDSGVYVKRTTCDNGDLVLT